MTDENKASFEREIKLEQQLADMTKDRNWHKQAYQGLVNGLADTASLQATIAQLQATLAAREARIRELEDWQNIVLGSGTDQETVIRMAANEYTKTAVQCWKDHTKKIEAERDAAVQEVERLKKEYIRYKLECYDVRRQLAASQQRVRELELDVTHRDRTVQEHIAKQQELQATLAAREARIEQWEASQAAMRKERQEAIEYLERLFFSMAPQCVSLGNLLGVCTQVDNAICGLKDQRDAAVQEAGRLQLTWTTARPTVAGNYWVRALMMHAGGFERGSFIVLFDGKVAFIAIGTRNEVIPIEVSSMKDSEWAGPIPLPTEAQQAGGSSGGEANHEGVGA